MKLKELNAVEVIKMVLGDERKPIKSEDELAQLLKKRMNKKELQILHAEVEGSNKEEVMSSLKIDISRYTTLLRNARKKLKNESVHGDFFYEKRIAKEDK